MDIECEVCGGKDFYKESGFFYCNECQTQTQELQEHVFQDETLQLAKLQKKLTKPKSTKTDKKVTTFECYNVIVHGLTMELIELGANANLKKVVLALWLMYLKKLNVIKEDPQGLPDLQLAGWRRDAEVIYDIPRRKKRKRPTASTSPSEQTEATTASLNSQSVKRERNKKKRALAEAHYEEFAKRSSHESSSLHNETLSSLRSTTDKNVTGKKITFNTYARSALKNRIKKRHLREHYHDFYNEMKCHKLTVNKSPGNYIMGAKKISINRLYAILYLGLLIINDKIQLGDFFRFIKEGHLSFNRFHHMFPEDYMHKVLNLNESHGHRMLGNWQFRTLTAQLAKLLDVSSYVKPPNLVTLTKKYCEELNLPDEICDYAVHLIEKSAPKLRFTSKTLIIPNYEGRVISIIIFVIKLLFSLDGVTEYEFSKFAKAINKIKPIQKEMFDIIKWIKFLEYRKLLVTQHHFPTNYFSNPDLIDSDLLVEFLNSHYFKVEEQETHLPKEIESYQQLLNKVKELQFNKASPFEFQPSFLPFTDYLEQILKSSRKNYLLNFADVSFRSNSLIYLMKPNPFLKLVNNGGDINIKNGGANDDMDFRKIENAKYVRENKEREEHHIVTVKLHSGEVSKSLDQILKEKDKPKFRSPHYLNDYQMGRQKTFDKNQLLLKKSSRLIKLGENTHVVLDDSEIYNTHFYPYERYWMSLQEDFGKQNRKKQEQFLKERYAQSFRIILEDCGRLLEQPPTDLFDEFQLTEVVLSYKVNFSKNDKYVSPDDKNLEHFVEKCFLKW